MKYLFCFFLFMLSSLTHGMNPDFMFTADDFISAEEFKIRSNIEINDIIRQYRESLPPILRDGLPDHEYDSEDYEDVKTPEGLRRYEEASEAFERDGPTAPAYVYSERIHREKREARLAGKTAELAVQKENESAEKDDDSIRSSVRIVKKGFTPPVKTVKGNHGRVNLDEEMQFDEKRGLCFTGVPIDDIPLREAELLREGEEGNPIKLRISNSASSSATTSDEENGENVLFAIGRTDCNGGLSLRATSRVTDLNLREELQKNTMEKIKSVNLVNQGFITDESLLSLARLPNLEFVNVENTSVTQTGIENFLRDKANHSFNPKNLHFTPLQ